jgi:glyoxylase-like metal-dependent hydrolase (beta-lactamase superfamily II)
MVEAPAAARPVLLQAPGFGEHVEVAAGVFWTRIALPFRLNHVNVYVIDDGRAWNIINTGIASQSAQEIWERLLIGPLAGRRVSKIIVTHHHPDHVGLATWLAQKVGAEVITEASRHHLCSQPNVKEA